VLEFETIADWRRHLRAYTKELQPVGFLERSLVRRIALYDWRLRRVEFFEAAAISANLQGTARGYAAQVQYEAELDGRDKPEFVLDEVKRYANMRLLPGSNALDKVMRYESHLWRKRTQASHELEVLQARRRGEPTPLARINVTSSG
jgi:hypothetical protein